MAKLILRKGNSRIGWAQLLNIVVIGSFHLLSGLAFLCLLALSSVLLTSCLENDCSGCRHPTISFSVSSYGPGVFLEADLPHKIDWPELGHMSTHSCQENGIHVGYPWVGWITSSEYLVILWGTKMKREWDQQLSRCTCVLLFTAM